MEMLDYNNISEIEILRYILNIAGYKNTKKRAEKLLQSYGNINNILSKDNEIIITDANVNEKFLKIKNLLHIYSSKKLYDIIDKQNSILSKTVAVVDFLKKEIGYEQNERFDILFLSNMYEILSFENISKGTIDRSIIFMRKILIKIAKVNAKYIILAHNHPSGALEPSTNDISLTIKIRDAVSIFEIALVDHIIVSKKGYYSFAEGGIL